LDKLKNSDCRVLPVMDKGNLVGLFTLENVGEFLLVRSALRPDMNNQPHAKHRSSTAA